MVIGGKIRGNAPQLADYLLTLAENERIRILDVDGRQDADHAALKDMLYSMELNSELTRSSNSVYHAYINPNPTDTTDRAMTMEEWQKSVDILTAQLGYEDQRRVVVLHEKPNCRVHVHIVYERYNHERGVMATYEHNYKAHDRARSEMEKVLDHKPTPQKNKNRDRHKQTLTEIWQRTNTAEQFIDEAFANGYKIAKGSDRPFRVIDEEGISFDLVRKLDGIKTKEVRQRFGDTELIPEKQAIREMQSAKEEKTQQQDRKPDPKSQPLPQPQQAVPQECKTEPIAKRGQDVPQTETLEEKRAEFLAKVKETRERNRSAIREITLYVLIALKVSFSFKGHLFKDNRPEQKSTLAMQFSSNASDLTIPAERQSDKTIHYHKAERIYKPT